LFPLNFQVVPSWVEWHPEHEFIFIFDRPFSDEFIFGENVTGVDIFPPARHPLLFYWWYEWSIPKVLKKYKPDVFVSPDGFMSLRTKTPTLMVLHDIAWKHFSNHVYWSAMKYYNYYVPKFIKGATRVATVSEFSKQDIVKSYGTDASKIDVVYNGSHKNYQPLVEEEQEEIRKEHSESQPYFLYLGSINPRKNVPNLIRAFEKFKQETDTPIKLLLVGRMREETGEIGDLLSTMKHKDDVVFMGYVSNELLPKIIASAFALTYVSLFEGFGIPLLEAMYCNVPTITSNCSSMPEVVGNAGLLVDPNSVTDISEKMVQLWTEPGLREELIEKGKVQRTKFSWDLTAQKMWDSLLKTIED